MNWRLLRVSRVHKFGRAARGPARSSMADSANNGAARLANNRSISSDNNNNNNNNKSTGARARLNLHSDAPGRR